MSDLAFICLNFRGLHLFVTIEGVDCQENESSRIKGRESCKADDPASLFWPAEPTAGHDFARGEVESNGAAGAGGGSLLYTVRITQDL